MRLEHPRKRENCVSALKSSYRGRTDMCNNVFSENLECAGAILLYIITLNLTSPFAKCSRKVLKMVQYYISLLYKGKKVLVLHLVSLSELQLILILFGFKIIFRTLSFYSDFRWQRFFKCSESEFKMLKSTRFISVLSVVFELQNHNCFQLLINVQRPICGQ